MKNKIKYIIGIIIIFIVFLNINIFLVGKKLNEKINNKAIFNIISETNINLENNLDLDGRSENYKNILETKVIGKGFFINNSGNFLTSSHLFNNKNGKYYIEINNEKFNFKILKNYQDKDIVLGKIINYKNKINKVALAPGNLNKVNKSLNYGNFFKGDNIFTYKNNNKNKGKIISVNQDIKELNLKNLIKTNIKLSPGDSGSPVFNKKGIVIGIFTAIKKGENISFFEKL